MGDFLIYEQDGGVVTLTMDRPDLRNTLSGEGQHEDFIEACARIEADESVKCVILTANGPAFSAGGNIKDMRDRKGLSAGNAYEIRNNYRREIQKIPISLYNLDVPTIAAVNGPAIGAGCDLATMCDIRIASERAKFAESFVKLGIIPGDGGAWLLPRIVGMAKAAELAFTGDTIDAEEALACGLATRVVPHERLMEEARELAGRIARNPAHALRMTKKLLREAQFSRLETLLEMSAAFQALAHHNPAHDEAVEALIAQLEKRQSEKKSD